MTPTLFLLMFGNFFLISIFAIGGFMASLPGMYSFLVESSGLLTPEQFAATVAFGQSLPGPNVLNCRRFRMGSRRPLRMSCDLRRHLRSLHLDCSLCGPFCPQSCRQQKYQSL